MSNPLSIPNFDTSGFQNTYLTAALAVGDTALTVASNLGFDSDTVTNNYMVIGTIGTEEAEVLKITSITAGVTITASTACVKVHKINEPVTLLKANQIRLYSSTTETGTFAELIKVSMTFDEPFTYYLDTAGTITTWYKIVFYNSTAAADYGKSVADVNAFMYGTLYGVANGYATLEEVLLAGGIDNKSSKTAKILQSIESVSKQIDSITGRIWNKRTFQSEYHDKFDNPPSIDDGKLYPKYWPIISVTTITNDGTSLTENAETSVGFFIIEPTRRYIELYSGSWSGDRRAVIMTYVAGFNFVPEDIKQICIEMVLINIGERVRTFVDGAGAVGESRITSYPKWVMDGLNAKRIIAIV